MRFAAGGSQSRTWMTWPTSPSAMATFTRAKFGSNRRCRAVMSLTLASLQALMASIVSGTSVAMGFSQNTCLPLAAHALIYVSLGISPCVTDTTGYREGEGGREREGEVQGEGERGRGRGRYRERGREEKRGGRIIITCMAGVRRTICLHPYSVWRGASLGETHARAEVAPIFSDAPQFSLHLAQNLVFEKIECATR